MVDLPLQLKTLSLQANEGGDRRLSRMVSSLLTRASCSFRRVPHGLSVLPNVISGSLARCGAFPKVPGLIARLDRSLEGEKGSYENVPRHTTSPAPGGGGFQILPLDHDESLSENQIGEYLATLLADLFLVA